MPSKEERLSHEGAIKVAPPPKDSPNKSGTKTNRTYTLTFLFPAGGSGPNSSGCSSIDSPPFNQVFARRTEGKNETHARGKFDKTYGNKKRNKILYRVNAPSCLLLTRLQTQELPKSVPTRGSPESRPRKGKGSKEGFSKRGLTSTVVCSMFVVCFLLLCGFMFLGRVFCSSLVAIQVSNEGLQKSSLRGNRKQSDRN